MTAEPRDVEEIRGLHGSSGCKATLRGDQLGDFYECSCGWRSDTGTGVGIARARLAAADRDNAELRGEVAEALKAVEYFDAQSKRRRDECDDLRAQLAAAQAQLAEARDIYALREAGIRVLDDEQCCQLACSSGACESCPCCQAGWCVWGHSGEIPERDLTAASNYRIWLDSAMEHNPVAKLLAEIEGAVGVEYDEPIAALSAAPQPEPETSRKRLPISPWPVGDLLAPNSPDEPLPKPNRRSSLRPKRLASDEPARGADLIRAERRRQVDEEGWGRECDLAHGADVLERAAISYAVYGDSDEPPTLWPWAREWWKPKDRLRNLVRAGALFQAANDVAGSFVSMRFWGQRDLVAAEIDRLLTASDEPARCEGFSWIGQSFAHCDECGKPYWEHAHRREHKPGARLFTADSEVLVPITPDDAARVRAKWDAPGPAASGTPGGGL